MRIKKRIVSLFLCLLLCVGLMTIPASASYAVPITSTGQVVDSITYRGKTINAVYRPYYENIGSDNTYGCFALIVNFYQSIYGQYVSNMWGPTYVPQIANGSFTETRSPRKGDIVRYNTHTHWALVKEVNGNTVTIIQQNGWDDKARTKAKVGVTINTSDTSVSFFTYSGYLPDNTTPSSGKQNATASVTVKKVNGTWITVSKKTGKKVKYTGIAQNKNGWWRVESGKVNFKATGVYKNDYGWWYCKKGKVQFNYTGIQKNSNGWWRIVKGKVDFNANGVFENEYGWWYCKGGKVQFDYTGIQKNSNGWWRIVKGKVDFNANGVFKNEYGWWLCRSGKVDFSYSGLAKNQYGTWSIKEGKVDFNDTKQLGYNEKTNYYVKEIEAEWGPETHLFSYSYDLTRKTLTITDRLTYYAGGWGGIGPYYFMANCLDGLLTKEMLKQYPEIAPQVSEGVYTEEMVLAYNPLIQEGKITTIVVNGIGKVKVDGLDDIPENYEDNTYHKYIKLTAKNGLLLKATETITDNNRKNFAGNAYIYSYDSAGLLSGITINYNDDLDEVIAIRRAETGFPSNIRYMWFYDDVEFEQYSLNYNSSKQLVEVEGFSSVSKYKTYDYNNGLLKSVNIADEKDYKLVFDYNQDGLLTAVHREYPEEFDSSTKLSWQTL